MELEELVKTISLKGEGYLDEAVHEQKSLEAANINNDGISAQIDYLGVDYVQELLDEE